ncbi:GTP-binding protein [Thermoplasmatales archaeon SW_10_69_26]|jgi:GTPase Era involved in 16S rRNA processing|nr:MAG: GTP-binding protein [Thermoplasmatales archaeon SW_10_69_26]
MAIGQKLKQNAPGEIFSWISQVFGKEQAKIGIYGPPNAGKTTLANRIVRDWAGDVMGAASEVPHETRRARRKANIQMSQDGKGLTLDIVDTPGIATKIDFNDFVEEHEMEENDAKDRAKEATEGVVEAIRWLDDVDGIILVMDATTDPFNQVNVTILGNLEARRLPVVIAANKIDLPESSPATLKNAFPQHPVVPISAISGYNIDQLYETMVENFS